MLLLFDFFSERERKNPQTIILFDIILSFGKIVTTEMKIEKGLAQGHFGLKSKKWNAKGTNDCHRILVTQILENTINSNKTLREQKKNTQMLFLWCWSVTVFWKFNQAILPFL